LFGRFIHKAISYGGGTDKAQKQPRVVHHKQKGRTDNAGWLGA